MVMRTPRHHPTSHIRNGTGTGYCRVQDRDHQGQNCVMCADVPLRSWHFGRNTVRDRHSVLLSHLFLSAPTRGSPVWYSSTIRIERSSSMCIDIEPLIFVRYMKSATTMNHTATVVPWLSLTHDGSVLRLRGNLVPPATLCRRATTVSSGHSISRALISSGLGIRKGVAPSFNTQRLTYDKLSPVDDHPPTQLHSPIAQQLSPNQPSLAQRPFCTERRSFRLPWLGCEPNLRS